MTDPTTTPTPPQGLTDEQLNAVINQAYEDSRSLVQAQSGLLSLDRFITRAAIAADRAARPAPAPVADVAQLLATAGVFKGSHGIKGLLDADAFWEQQPYGTRLYYGDGIADYLQRGVLRSAVTLLEQFGLGGWIVPTVEQVTPDHEANHLRTATKMALTPEEVEARFRAWWAESYPNAPAGAHAVQSHVDFAMHLLGGEVAA